MPWLRPWLQNNYAMKKNQKEKQTDWAIKALTALSRACSQAQQALHENKPNKAMTIMARLRPKLPVKKLDLYIPPLLEKDLALVNQWKRSHRVFEEMIEQTNKLGSMLLPYRNALTSVDDALDIAAALTGTSRVMARYFFEKAEQLADKKKPTRKPKVTVNVSFGQKLGSKPAAAKKKSKP